MTERPQLIYFDIRGRAEPIRLLLEDVGADYEDVQVSEHEWPELKPTTPFGRMPVYRERDLEIPETYAILYHLGRKHGLLGTDEEERIRCDVTLEAIKDHGNRVAAVFGALSGSNSPEVIETFIREELPERLAALERYYANNTTTGFWAGDAVTIADYPAFYLVEGIENQFPDTLKYFGKLKEFNTAFAARPRIRAFLESPRRQTALFYGPKGKIYPRK